MPNLEPQANPDPTADAGDVLNLDDRAPELPLTWNGDPFGNRAVSGWLPATRGTVARYSIGQPQRRSNAVVFPGGRP